MNDEDRRGGGALDEVRQGVLRPLDRVQTLIQHLVTVRAQANDCIPLSSAERYWPLPPCPVDLKITLNDACECALKTKVKSCLHYTHGF